MSFWDSHSISPPKWLKDNHPKLDPRVTPAGPELARSTLKGIVNSAAFTEGTRATIICSNIGLKENPDPLAANNTELIFGETIVVLKTSGGWAWVQATNDDYVGYLPEVAFNGISMDTTHKVSVPLTHFYGTPDMKQPALMAVPMGAVIQATDRKSKGYIEVIFPNGNNIRVWAFENHLTPIPTPLSDATSVAESFEKAPYLWAGRTVSGIDCSGLVQLVHKMVGLDLPRDTDMQLAALKNDIPEDEPFQRGDILFSPGHVVMMVDDTHIIHANATHMQVVIETLDGFLARIKESHGQSLTGRKRI